MKDDGFLVHLLDMLHPLGGIRHRRMFGGVGIYKGEVMFALTFDSAVYLRTAPSDQAAFESLGMGPFSYESRGKTAQIKSYWQMPEYLLDEPDELLSWAERAIEAAFDAARKKAKPKAKK